MSRTQQEEVLINKEALEKQLADLLAKENCRGQYALMHDGHIECILKDFHDAVIMGNKLYGDKPFSVQPIAPQPINLGSYSYK